jgi:hypothetical protein
MIVLHHFCAHNGFQDSSIPLNKKALFLHVFFLNQGKVGVVLFFAISAWFLCNSEASIRNSIKRVWILDKTVLFWSLLLGFFEVFRHPDTVSFSNIFGIVFPISSNVWWYVTAYAGFVLLSPFIITCLRTLQRSWHLTLCIILLIVGPIFQEIPWTYHFDTEDVEMMVILFVVITYIRWYLKIPKILIGTLFLVIGLFVSFIQTYTGYIIFESSLNIATLLKAAGIFILFAHLNISSKLINRLASYTLGIYLISDYQPVRDPYGKESSIYNRITQRLE